MQTKPKLGSVVRVAAGNFLEMYDFMVFGYYASFIGRAFFPKGSEFATLMLAFATFGVGFLMRPLGALVLGAYIDRQGCRKGLILTLALMSFGTVSIACLPGYQTLGILAPLLVVTGVWCRASQPVLHSGAYRSICRKLPPPAIASALTRTGPVALG